MDTSRYISMCTDRGTVFEVCQSLPGVGGWVCYPQGMRDISMGSTLVIQNPVILPELYCLWALCADNVSPAKACTAFECICMFNFLIKHHWYYSYSIFNLGGVETSGTDGHIHMYSKLFRQETRYLKPFSICQGVVAGNSIHIG